VAMITEKEVKELMKIQAELAKEEMNCVKEALNETDKLDAERDVHYHKIRYYTLAMVLKMKPEEYTQAWKEATM